MSVKFNLKKGAYIKKGFVGFSYTTFFFNAFVPIFRGDFKGTFMLFIVWLLTKGPSHFFKYIPHINLESNSIISKFIVSFLDIKIKYLLIAKAVFLILVFMIVSGIWILIGDWYNKNYTKRLLNNGYAPLENDNYSLALLKEYGYLEYTEEEKRDSEKMKLYKTIVEEPRRDERAKFYIFMTTFIILNIVTWVTVYIVICKAANTTHFELF